MAELATLQTWLTEAEAALHALHTGTKVVKVRVSIGGGGEQETTYTQASAAHLQSYIDSLRAQIAALGGTVTGLRRRAIGVDL